MRRSSTRGRPLLVNLVNALAFVQLSSLFPDPRAAKPKGVRPSAIEGEFRRERMFRYVGETNSHRHSGGGDEIRVESALFRRVGTWYRSEIG